MSDILAGPGYSFVKCAHSSGHLKRQSTRVNVTRGRHLTNITHNTQNTCDVTANSVRFAVSAAELQVSISKAVNMTTPAAVATRKNAGSRTPGGEKLLTHRRPLHNPSSALVMIALADRSRAGWRSEITGRRRCYLMKAVSEIAISAFTC